MIETVLGPAIRAFRERRGIKLEDLSERTGLSLPRLEALEDGRGIDVIVDKDGVRDVNPEYRRVLDALGATFGSDWTVRSKSEP